MQEVNTATDSDTNGSAVTSVPTLGQWALILLSIVLAGFTAMRLHRARRI
ncbi:IPTL-CTERM sorting domain-containing protein [Ottowia thiooxydans]|nr:IPTL-CTERM sorting domain-containing protein [Ottowia thiooxydans]